MHHLWQATNGEVPPNAVCAIIALTENSAVDQVNGDVKQTDYAHILRRWDAYIIWDTEHT